MTNRKQTALLLLLGVLLLLIGSGVWYFWPTAGPVGEGSAQPEPAGPLPALIGEPPGVQLPEPVTEPPVEPIDPEPVPNTAPSTGGEGIITPATPPGQQLRVGYASNRSMLDLFVAEVVNGRARLGNSAGPGGLHYLLNRQRPWLNSLDGSWFSLGRVYTMQAVVPDGGNEMDWLRPGVRFAQTTFSVS